jgi:hypothetical protein
MEFFEALKTFIIDTRNEGLKEVAGTKLSYEFFAHNEGPYSKWHISDIASGLAIMTKLPTLAACKEYIKNMPEDMRARIDAAKQNDWYAAQCEKVANFKPIKVEDFNFNDAYDELDRLYAEDSDQLMLLEKKHKKDNDKQVSKETSWKDRFLTFNDIGVTMPSGMFKPLISSEFAGAYDWFFETFGSLDTARLIEKLSYITRTLEVNGRSRPGDSEKVNGVDHPIWELKIGETSSHKPIRSLYFIKTDTDGTKYVIFASLFIHTDKNLTASERNSGRNAYFTANPRK